MNLTSLKLAICLTFLFFAKITFSQSAPQDLCLELAEAEGIEFTTLYQCNEVKEVITAKRTVFKTITNSMRDPYLCSFIINTNTKLHDEHGKEFYADIESILFYDLSHKFRSQEYQVVEQTKYFSALFQDGKSTRSATVEMTGHKPNTANLIYTLYKNRMMSSQVQIQTEMECEIFRR